jgi:hypothetical protein
MKNSSGVPGGSSHLWNAPLKILTPIIAKMSMTNEQTKSTFVIEGIDARRAFTTNFIPSSLEMTLNGLNALSALNAFKAYKDCISIFKIMRIRSIMDAVTTNPSS